MNSDPQKRQAYEQTAATHAHTRGHASTHAHTHARTHTCMRGCHKIHPRPPRPLPNSLHVWAVFCHQMNPRRNQHMHARMHTHTHARTHAHTHALTHMPAHASTCQHMPAGPHIRHRNTHAQMHSHALAWAQAFCILYSATEHTLQMNPDGMGTGKMNPDQKNAGMRAEALTRAPTHARTQGRARAYKAAHRHACCTSARTHARTHTHTWARGLGCIARMISRFSQNLRSAMPFRCYVDTRV